MILFDTKELLQTLRHKPTPNEIRLSLFEDEYTIWLSICCIYGQKMGQQEYIESAKISKDDFYSNIEMYKKEAYRIKRLIKQSFSTIRVSSGFSWK